MAGAVKLIGSYTSLFCTRVEWALKLKGVQYEPIAESLVILQYIDETWSDNNLLPQDSYQRAMAHFWAKFTEEKAVSDGSIYGCLERGRRKGEGHGVCTRIIRVSREADSREEILQWRRQD
ncbi:hypothetical protein D5086_028046 [Populus alba]|uniref:Uncharacterized protein n=1 Tax=Populus alba TaxID=43335 RepID=A0ACC4AXG4_POPAL